MKLLYYSPDDLEIAEVSKQFAQAGIPCVVRHSAICRGEDPNHACAELWIRNDKDTHKAMMLCVQLGVGFAKREPLINSKLERERFDATFADEMNHPEIKKIGLGNVDEDVDILTRMVAYLTAHASLGK